MYSTKYQGGTVCEVFTAQGKDPLSKFAIRGSGIERVYDKEVKGYIIILDGLPTTTQVKLPKLTKHSLNLVHRFLLLQIFLGKGQNFGLELGVTDVRGNKRRIMLSTNQREVKVTPLHAKLPLSNVLRNSWLNLCFDISSFVTECWHNETFKSLDALTIGASCKLRRVFTMKCSPPDTTCSGDFVSPTSEPKTPIPTQCLFPSDLSIVTKVLDMVAITKDSSNSMKPVLDLNNSESDALCSPSRDSFHIAFGSKVKVPPIKKPSALLSTRSTVSAKTQGSAVKGKPLDSKESHSRRPFSDTAATSRCSQRSTDRGQGTTHARKTTAKVDHLDTLKPLPPIGSMDMSMTNESCMDESQLRLNTSDACPLKETTSQRESCSFNNADSQIEDTSEDSIINVIGLLKEADLSVEEMDQSMNSEFEDAVPAFTTSELEFSQKQSSPAISQTCYTGTNYLENDRLAMKEIQDNGNYDNENKEHIKSACSRSIPQPTEYCMDSIPNVTTSVCAKHDTHDHSEKTTCHSRLRISPKSHDLMYNDALYSDIDVFKLAAGNTKLYNSEKYEDCNLKSYVSGSHETNSGTPQPETKLHNYTVESKSAFISCEFLKGVDCSINTPGSPCDFHVLENSTTIANRIASSNHRCSHGSNCLCKPQNIQRDKEWQYSNRLSDDALDVSIRHNDSGQPNDSVISSEKFAYWNPTTPIQSSQSPPRTSRISPDNNATTTTLSPSVLRSTLQAYSADGNSSVFESLAKRSVNQPAKTTFGSQHAIDPDSDDLEILSSQINSGISANTQALPEIDLSRSPSSQLSAGPSTINEHTVGLSEQDFQEKLHAKTAVSSLSQSHIDLIYEPLLNCYYDPETGKYYEVVE